MDSKLERIERVNIDLQRKLREKESEVKRLLVRSSLDRDLKKTADLTQRLKEALRSNECLESEVVEMRDRESKLQHELDILRTIVQLRDHPELLHVADCDVRCRKMEEEQRRMKEEIVSLTEKNRVFCDASSKVTAEVDHLRYVCAQLTEELERNVNDLQEMYNERESFANEVECANSSMKQLQKQLEAKQSEVESLHDTISRRDAQLHTMRLELEELKEDELHSRKTWEEGQRILEHTRDQLDENVRELEKCSRRLKHVEEQHEADQKKGESMVKSIEALKKENRHLRDELAHLQVRSDEVEAMARKVAISEAENDKRGHVVSTLEQQNADLLSKVLHLEKSNLSLQQELHAKQDELALQAEEMHVLSKNLVARIEHIEAERDASVQNEAKLRRELASAQDRISMLTVMSAHHQQLNRAAAMGTSDTPQLSHRSSSASVRNSQAPPVGASSRRTSAVQESSCDQALSPPTPVSTPQDSFRARLEKFIAPPQ
jgi:predicted  nucleic acid-binding Zn-ribbon protein